MKRPDRNAPQNLTSGTELETLFREHNEALLRLLVARLGSPDDAREVAQEAYARLLKLGETRAVSFERALLFRIAQNAATDRLRLKANSQPHDSWDLFEREDPRADPQRAAGALQKFDLLHRIVIELPPKCWKAFIAIRYRGQSSAEVAAVMGVSERTVRSYVSRTLAYCQVRLDEEMGKSTGEDSA